MSLNIRPLQAGDRNQLYELRTTIWNHAYQELLPTYYLQNELPDEAIAWAIHACSNEALAARKMPFLVAEDQGHLLGYIETYPGLRPPTALKRTEFKAWDPQINQLGVSVEHQRTGIGRALMVEAAKQMWELGVLNVRLDTFRDDENALAFYRKMGGVAGLEFNGWFSQSEIPMLKVLWIDIRVLSRS